MAILYFIIYLGPTMRYKKFKVILIRNEGVMSFFVISHFHNIYVCNDMGILCHCNYCQVEFNVSNHLSFGAGSLNPDPSACNKLV